MRKIVFANTQLEVSPLSLGTVNFGTSTPEAEAFYQMDHYRELGNFIDTAHVYGDWEPGGKSASEKVIGKWLKSRGMNGRMIISSKGAHPVIGDPAFRPRMSKAEIAKDLEESLTYLGVDAIDMYFLHRDDVSRPVEEIVDIMEDFRKQGKIRFYGVSNWKLDRIIKAQEYAHRIGTPGFTCNQLMWSLAAILYENVSDKTLVAMDKETYAHHSKNHMNVMAYRSIAKGYFSHKYAGTCVRESVLSTYNTPANDKIYEQLLSLSAETGIGITPLSLAYFEHQPFPSVAIASFSNRNQLDDGLSFLETDIPFEVSKRLQALRNDLI